MGSSAFNGVTFDLNLLLSSSVELNFLVSPFSIEKINAMVSFLHSNNGPGPDGFNNFVKKCWPIICENFYARIRLSIRKIFDSEALMVHYWYFLYSLSILQAYISKM